jgi:hypothetical protein
MTAEKPRFYNISIQTGHAWIDPPAHVPGPIVGGACRA